MSNFDKRTLQALEATAAASAAYLDACDSGAGSNGLDPEYYRVCGDLLIRIFALVEPESDFPDLLKRSPADRGWQAGLPPLNRCRPGRTRKQLVTAH